MKQSLLYVLLVVSTATFAQKEKVDVEYDKKTEVVTVNDVPFLKIVKETQNLSTTFNVQTLDGKTWLICNPVYYSDSREISQSNPNGRRSYFDFIFIDDKELRVDAILSGAKQLAKMIYDNKLIVDSKLDLEAAKLFARKIGTVNYEKRITAR